MNKPAPSDSILSLKKGSKARITKISDGGNLNRLMLSHGLRVGSVINILQKRGHSVVVGSGPTRIALGPAMASQLQIQAIN